MVRSLLWSFKVSGVHRFALPPLYRHGAGLYRDWVNVDQKRTFRQASFLGIAISNLVTLNIAPNTTPRYGASGRHCAHSVGNELTRQD